MLLLVRDALAGQFGAAILMLRDCLDRVDHAARLAPVGRFPFWHVAYHVLYTTDLYLSPDHQAFRPPPFHREDYNFLGRQPWPPFKEVVADQPFDTATLLAYLDACRDKASLSLAAETDSTLAGPSGFPWLPFTRLELHLYNVRHLQHHTGQLAATLRRERGDSVVWVRSARA